MAWTSARTWVVEIVSAAQLNEQLRDNTRYLHGDDGDTTLLDGLRLENDGNFGMWKAGGAAYLGMAANAFWTYSTANLYHECYVSGTAQFRVGTAGAIVPSGRNISFPGVAGTSYALSTPTGAAKALAYGASAMTFTDGGYGTVNINTGLTTIGAFNFSVATVREYQYGRINAIAAGTVTLIVYAFGGATYAGTIHWMAAGV